MNLNFKNKKIACSFNEFNNNEFNKFLYNLSKQNDLTIYSRQKISKKILGNRIKISILKENKNTLFTLLDKFSKNKSSPLQNYYFIEKFVASSLHMKIFFSFKFILNKMGLLISKNYLRRSLLKTNKKGMKFDYLITDFRFNEIYTNHEITNFALENNIPIIVILYSWDNLFSEDVNLKGTYYFVGSLEVGKILNKRHCIPNSKIFYFNSFQFSYLKKLKKIKKSREKYILYSLCTEQESSIAKEEMEIINGIGEILIKKKSNIKLYVRPYPFLYSKTKSKIKFKYPNIVVKEYGKQVLRRENKKKKEYMRYEYNYDSKLSLLKNTICHINFLSTIGIESVLLGRNTIFLNIKKKFNIFEPIKYLKSNYFKTKFLDHYKIFSKKNLFVTSFNELENNLSLILENKNLRNKYRQEKFIKNFFLN